MGVDGLNSGVNVSLPKDTVEPTAASLADCFSKRMKPSVPNFNGTDDKENTNKMLIYNKWQNISSALKGTLLNFKYGKILIV